MDLIKLWELPTQISSHAAVLTNRVIKGSNWNLREMHGYKNRWNHSRIYKDGRKRHICPKEILAEEINSMPYIELFN